ncbi:hypothetical protein L1286_12025 [Pseudoalteromonas sp. SMS1]|uniref:hypothetical protein n=1 Tax=Pseudoalteromonas sp. SMS1 TaxID=2908894 RepID=UPI001F3681EB|nr:hypothetical protein [Pseudoalteromonas sp. SMS1]MCF2858204.1 hypothetical protein [Pseudoalteromonas sp. SMS1]
MGIKSTHGSVWDQLHKLLESGHLITTLDEQAANPSAIYKLVDNAAIQTVEDWNAVWPVIIEIFWSYEDVLWNNDKLSVLFNGGNGIDAKEAELIHCALMYVIMQKMGVVNISLHSEGYVALRSGRALSSIFLKLQPNLCSKSPANKQPYFNWRDAFTPTNAWQRIDTEFSVVIPPITVTQEEQIAVQADFISKRMYLPLPLPFATPFNSDDVWDQTVDYSNHQPFIVYTGTDLKIYDESKDTSSDTQGELHTFNLDGQTGDVDELKGILIESEWVNFVPRLVAYNWTADPDFQIKNNTSIENYPQMLSSLAFEIPSNLTLIVQYPPHETEAEQKAATVIDGKYASTLRFTIPKPPSRTLFKPVALADLSGKRPNHPFCSL